jgi:hypothetical protein
MKSFKMYAPTIIAACSISLLAACSSTTKETHTTEYIPAPPRVVVQPPPVVVTPPPVVATTPATSTSVTKETNLH